MHSLCFDTAFSTVSISLFKEKKNLSTIEYTHNNDLSSTLIVAIRNILRAQKVEFSQIKRIITTYGVGSFTGIRVGNSTAQAIAIVSKGEVIQKSYLSAYHKYTNTPLNYLWTQIDKTIFAQDFIHGIPGKIIVNPTKLNLENQVIFTQPISTYLI